MHFEQVLQSVKLGLRIRRASWPLGEWAETQHPDARSKMTRPYLFRADGQGQRVPWSPSTDDLFASDWSVIA